MKKYANILLLISFCQLANAQDKVKRFEFGPTLITVNSLSTNYYSNTDKPSVEYSNGLFFRYTRNKFAFRSSLSYNESHFKYYAPVGCIDCTSGESSNKDFKIGIGIQYSLLRKKEWLYGFTDLSYRNVFSSGFVYGGIAGLNNSFSSSTNGLNGLVGLGLKCKLFEDIFIMPELAYNIFFGSVDYKTTHLTFGQTTRSHYIRGDLSPIAKLHLTVRF